MKSVRERRPFLVGIVSLFLIAAAVGLAFSINRFEGLRGVYTLSADLKDAAGLQPGNEVRVAGVKVGQVKSLRLAPGAARVIMEIDQEVRIPQETHLEVKLKTLLGQKFIDLQFPRVFVEAAASGDDVDSVTNGFLDEGALIPRDQTTVPFDIYQAATEGTAALEEIDKVALREMLVTLGRTVRPARDELRRAFSSLDRAGEVLGGKSADIARLLKSSSEATAVLDAAGQDLEGVLSRGADVLGTLAQRRATVSSLLAATSDLTENLGVLIQVARGSVNLGVADLNKILVLAESEMDTIDEALGEIDIAQEMFAQPASFGRFIEGEVCAVITEDTCVAEGSPDDPGLPARGRQPLPDTLVRASAGRR
jgi:phospholipid/cholesterol/gamma-HCH transport system substrate-binding protein